MLGCDMYNICQHKKECGEIDCPYLVSQIEETERFCFEQSENGYCNESCECYGNYFCEFEEVE